MVGLGPLPRTGTSLSVLSAPAPGASNTPPPTPATETDSHSVAQPSPALRGRVEHLQGIDALLMAAQLRASNDAMLRALLPNVTREAVEMALTRFIKMRTEGDVVDAEHTLAEEVRRLQDGVTTDYIARGKEGDAGSNGRQVPPDLSQRMEDLEEQSRKNTDTAVERADAELEAMAQLVGEQGDPHNSADLALAKRVQAAMRTLQLVRDDQIAKEKEKVKRTAAPVPEEPKLASQDAQHHFHSQQCHRPTASVHSASLPHRTPLPPYEHNYPPAPRVEMERPPGGNGYQLRPPTSAAPEYTVQNATQISAPVVPNGYGENLEPFSAGPYNQRGEGATPAPQAAPHLHDIPSSKPSQPPYSAPHAYPASVRKEPRQELCEDTGETIPSKRPHPPSASHPTAPWSRMGDPSRDQLPERLPSGASYPTVSPYVEGYLTGQDPLSSYPDRYQSEQNPPTPGIETSGRMSHMVYSNSQNPVSTESSYPAGVSSKASRPERGNDGLENRTTGYQQGPADLQYPCDQQTYRLPPLSKQKYQDTLTQARLGHAGAASSRPRPTYPNAEPRMQEARLNTPPTRPDIYPPTSSFASYQQADERHGTAPGPQGTYPAPEELHRPMHTSDPPGFQEASPLYSNLPQPPSPDIRTPPPEYGIGRPHSLSHLDYPNAARYPESRAPVRVYQPGRVAQQLPPQYPPGMYAGSTAALESRYGPQPDVYQSPRPGDVVLRPQYSNGYAMADQQSRNASNLYSDPLTQGPPPLRSRHSLLAYANGFGRNSQRPYSAQAYSQAPPYDPQRPLTSDPYNTGSTYTANQFTDPTVLRRASTHPGPRPYSTYPSRYGEQGSAPYGQEQRFVDPRLMNQSQNHPGFPLDQGNLPDSQSSYPQRRTSYIDSGNGLQRHPPAQLYTSSGYGSMAHLQDVGHPEQLEGGISNTNNVYGPYMPPLGYGPPNAEMTQPTVTGLVPQAPSMTGNPGMRVGAHGLPPSQGLPNRGTAGGASPLLVGQVPPGSGQIAQYPPPGHAMAEGVHGSHIPHRNEPNLWMT